jgi:hypothetical protein
MYATLHQPMVTPLEIPIEIYARCEFGGTKGRYQNSVALLREALGKPPKK